MTRTAGNTRNEKNVAMSVICQWSAMTANVIRWKRKNGKKIAETSNKVVKLFVKNVKNMIRTLNKKAMSVVVNKEKIFKLY
jgi:hypothetical protein